MNRVALIILDGWGINHNPKVSAIEAADTPTIDKLMKDFPHATLTTYGEDVGLPEGQMGNSEVGHINIGAGRIVYQELARINKSMREKELLTHKTFLDAIQYADQHTRKIHILGLVSDGGVHSHIQHLLDLTDMIQKVKAKDTQIYIHAFTDGRDTDPRSGKKYLQTVMQHIEHEDTQLASVVGRYYAMDRDKRWDRVKVAYDLLVHGQGEKCHDILSEIEKKYDEGLTDEFLSPIIREDLVDQALISKGDVVIFFNFRTDRPRQLTDVLTQRDMHEFNMHKLSLYFVTFADYDQTFENIHVLYEKENLTKTLGETISQAGLTQVRIAETEKYPHVTFFFNGGIETRFPGEERILVPSPKVATYDLQPEMSAPEITEKLIAFVQQNQPDFICLNYANADMVGHTGVFDAAVKAAETVDKYLGQLLETLLQYDYLCVIIADHGNSDMMVNEDGSPNTAHTTFPVPVILAGKDIHTDNCSVKNGKLADLAPSILSLMNIPVPGEMTGQIIFTKNN